MECITVSKITVTEFSDSCHLISQWGDELKICLVHKDEYWKGVFSDSDYLYFTDHLSIGKDKYVSKLKDALTTNSQDSNFIFSFDSTTLKWKIVNNQVSIVHGRCKFKEHFIDGGNQLLIDTLLNMDKCNKDRLRHQENETLELGRQLRVCIEKFEVFSSLKNTMEIDMYNKFLQLLNAKKQRISDMEEFYFEVKPETSVRHPSDSPKIKVLDDSKGSKNVHRMSDSDTD